jgi:rhodanese-related sulfurtransferase
MSLKTISPAQARDLMNDGAVLVDIRDADEHAREHIPGATHLPLSEIKPGRPELENERAVIYHCRSGNRTMANGEALKEAANCEAYVVEGGLEAWRKRPGSRSASTASSRCRSSARCRSAPALWWSSAWRWDTWSRRGCSCCRDSWAPVWLQAGVTGWCGMANLLQRHAVEPAQLGTILNRRLMRLTTPRKVIDR